MFFFFKYYLTKLLKIIHGRILIPREKWYNIINEVSPKLSPKNVSMKNVLPHAGDNIAQKDRPKPPAQEWV